MEFTNDDYVSVFSRPFPRLEQLASGQHILRRTERHTLILPSEEPIYRALFLNKISKEEYRDYRLAHLRRRWPDNLEIRDYIELDQLLAELDLTD